MRERKREGGRQGERGKAGERESGEAGREFVVSLIYALIGCFLYVHVPDRGIKSALFMYLDDALTN